MGSLILDAVTSLLAQLVAIIVPLLVTSIVAVLAVLIYAVLAAVEPLFAAASGLPISPSTPPSPTLRVEATVLHLGRTVGLALIVLHALLASLAEEAHGERSVIRLISSAIIAPLSLAIVVALSNVLVAVVNGVAAFAAADAARMRENAQAVGAALFGMMQSAMAMTIANVIPPHISLLAMLALAVHLLLYALLGAILIAYRLFGILAGVSIHLAALCGFLAAPAAEAKEASPRMAVAAEGIRRIAQAVPIALAARAVLTVSLGLVGSMAGLAQREILDAYHASAKAAAGTNFGLLRAIGSATDNALTTLRTQLNLPSPPSACALSGEETCADHLARSFLVNLISLFLVVALLAILWNAAGSIVQAALSTADRARGWAEGHASGWATQGGARGFIGRGVLWGLRALPRGGGREETTGRS